MSKLSYLMLGTVLAASTLSIAHAEGPWSVGAGALVTPDPYKGHQDRVYPYPIVGYEGDSFYVRSLNAGYYLWNDDTDKLSLTAYYSPLHFRPKDSDYDSMRSLNYRHSTVMAGVSYVHYTDYGFLRTVLAGDILNNSNGITWDTAWLYRYNVGQLTFTPGIGVGWNSKNQNKYYYGVNHSESQRSGLEAYKPGASFSPYAELSVNYQLNKDWTVFGMGRYVRLSSEITDSPMTNKHWTGVLLTGVTYSF